MFPIIILLLISFAWSVLYLNYAIICHPSSFPCHPPLPTMLPYMYDAPIPSHTLPVHPILVYASCRTFCCTALHESQLNNLPLRCISTPPRPSSLATSIHHIGLSPICVDRLLYMALRCVLESLHPLIIIVVLVDSISHIISYAHSAHHYHICLWSTHSHDPHISFHQL